MASSSPSPSQVPSSLPDTKLVHSALGRLKSKSRFNSPGQGRKISYSLETEMAIATHIREKLAKGEKVTVQYACSYAKQLVCSENPSFVASSGWAHRFLARHNIALQTLPRYKIRNAEAGHVIDYKGRPLSYSPETDLAIADFVRDQQAKGSTITNSRLRNYARQLIQKESPTFTASASWAQNFLLRHRLSLNPSDGALKVHETATCLASGQQEQHASAIACQASTPTSTMSVSQASPLDGSISNYSLFQTLSAFNEGQASIHSKHSEKPKDQPQFPCESDSAEGGSGLANPSLLLCTPQNPQPASHLSIDNLARVLIQGDSGNLTLDSAAGGSFSQASQTKMSESWASSPVGMSSLPLGTEERMLPASCRPLSYPKETDDALAAWVKGQQSVGLCVTFSKLREQAKKMIQPENPNFHASVGWVTPFLLRNRLDLSINKKNIARTLAEGCRGAPIHGTQPSLQDELEEIDLPVNTKKTTSKPRFTLSEKYDIVCLIRQYNLSLQHSSRVLGVAVSTLSGWVKMVDSRGLQQDATKQAMATKAVTEDEGSLFLKDKEDVVAEWVATHMHQGHCVTVNDIQNYVQTLVATTEDSTFVPTPQWVEGVLQRHEIYLPKSAHLMQEESLQGGRNQAESPSHEDSEKPLPPDTEQYLAEWVKQQVTDRGRLPIRELQEFTESVVCEHYPSFSVPLEWVFRFLLKHKLQLEPKPVLPDKLPPDLMRSGSKRTVLECEDDPSLAYQDGPDREKMSKADDQPTSDSVFACSYTQPPTTSSTDMLLSLPSMVQPTPECPSSPLTLIASKPAREFTRAEKERVVRYANSTTLQKAALRYGVAAPTVWRWRMELKMYSPRYTADHKRLIIEFADKNTSREASQKFGISTKTIHNWRKSLSQEPGPSRSPPGSSSFSSIYGSTLDAEGRQKGLPLAEVGSCQPFDFMMLSDAGGGGLAVSSQQTASASLTSTSMSKPMGVGLISPECDMEYDIDSAGEAQGGGYLSRWRPEEKIEILKYAQIHTPKLASERFGVKPSTIVQWMKTMGPPPVSATDVSVYLNSPFLVGNLQQGQMDTLPSHSMVTGKFDYAEYGIATHIIFGTVPMNA